MIRVTDLHKRFGGVHAVDGASIEIKTGTITGLIGPNGAGKTTLFNVIAGAFPPTSGKVELDGEDITGLAAHELFGKGLLRTFQIAHEFTSLTVRDNLMMVPPGQPGESLIGAWFKPAEVKASEVALRNKADEVLAFLNLTHIADERAGNLSGGQKKLLELVKRKNNVKVIFNYSVSNIEKREVSSQFITIQKYRMTLKYRVFQKEYFNICQLLIYF